jgi:hypothetical protein
MYSFRTLTSISYNKEKRDLAKVEDRGVLMKMNNQRKDKKW